MELRRHMTRIAPLPTQELLKPSNVQVPVLGRCVEAGGVEGVGVAVAGCVQVLSGLRFERSKTSVGILPHLRRGLSEILSPTSGVG